MPFVVMIDGTIEEWSLLDLAAEIGPEVNTPDGIRLRWQAACVDGQWGVVDARRPHDLLFVAASEDEAMTVAAGDLVIAETYAEAEAAARDLKE